MGAGWYRVTNRLVNSEPEVIVRYCKNKLDYTIWKQTIGGYDCTVEEVFILSAEEYENLLNPQNPTLVSQDEFIVQ